MNTQTIYPGHLTSGQHFIRTRHSEYGDPAGLVVTFIGWAGSVNESGAIMNVDGLGGANRLNIGHLNVPFNNYRLATVQESQAIEAARGLGVRYVTGTAESGDHFKIERQPDGRLVMVPLVVERSATAAPEPTMASLAAEAPDWVRWLAQDAGGSVWGYSHKPIVWDEHNCWGYERTIPAGAKPAVRLGALTADGSWRDTLYERGPKLAVDLSTAHGDEVRELRAKIDSLEAELERERMSHAACGVIALSNTRDSLARSMDMSPEYKSASASDVARAVGREIEWRERAEQAEARLKRYSGDSATLYDVAQALQADWGNVVEVAKRTAEIAVDCRRAEGMVDSVSEALDCKPGFVVERARELKRYLTERTDALQRASTALGLMAGTDTTTELVPAIEALQTKLSESERLHGNALEALDYRIECIMKLRTVLGVPKPEDLLLGAERVMSSLRSELEDAKANAEDNYGTRRAWDAVADALNQARPKWLDGSGSAMDLACAAIIDMGREADDSRRHELSYSAVCKALDRASPGWWKNGLSGPGNAMNAIMALAQKAEAAPASTTPEHEVARLKSCEDAWKAVHNALYEAAPDVKRATGIDSALARVAYLVSRQLDPLAEDMALLNRLYSFVKDGQLVRDSGGQNPHPPRSLASMLHSLGWVQRDLRLALDAASPRGRMHKPAHGGYAGEPCERAGLCTHVDGVPTF